MFLKMVPSLAIMNESFPLRGKTIRKFSTEPSFLTFLTPFYMRIG